ncbi:MAG: hypothetical protein ABI781_07085 [Burkholderiales bacterium]
MTNASATLDIRRARGSVIDPSRPLRAGSIASALAPRCGPIVLIGGRLRPHRNRCQALEKMLCDASTAAMLRDDPRASPGLALRDVPVQGDTGMTFRRTLRLQVQSLTDSDIAKVATFLRVGRGRLRCDWEIVFGGELHVLMLGDGEPDTLVGMLDDPLAMLRIVDAGTERRDAGSVLLVRPLQYDAFIEALSAVEQRVHASHGAATTSAPADVVPASREADAVPAVAEAAKPGASFRLRRWPPAAALQGHRYYLRLASCLSARHVGIDELVRLSNVSRPRCEEFLATLLAQAVLDVRPTPATAPTAAPPARSARSASSDATPQAAAPARSRPLPDTSLFGKIRRKLGLTLLR